MKVFVDFHHGSLYYSLQLLFEGRFGWELFRPIGLEWCRQNFWSIADPYPNPEFTASQYLGTDHERYVPYKQLNGDYHLKDGIYYVFDPDNHCHQKAIRLDKFKEMDIDIVIASHILNISPFLRLVKEYKPTAKFIHQMGNDWHDAVDLKVVKNLMMSTKKIPLPSDVNAVFYHQEFSTETFNWAEPKYDKRIVCLMNDLQNYPDAGLFYQMEEKMPEWKFEAHGGGNRDGSISGFEKIAQIIKDSMFVWHIKYGGDGYGHCYDQETEVLTDKGWKFFEELDQTEKIASLRNDELVYEKPTKYISYFYEGELLHFASKNIDLLVTPEHRMYVNRYDKYARPKGWRVMKAKDCDFMKPYHPRRALGFLKAPKKWQGKDKVNKWWAKFLGWYLSEGCTWKDKRTGWCHRVCIANTNEDNKREIAFIISKLGYHPQIQKKQVIVTRKELYEKVKGFGLCNEKFIPREILEANREIQQAFLDCLLAGDGCKETNSLWRLTTTSKKLADNTQELAIKLGYRTSLIKSSWKTKANKEVYRVNISSIRRDKKCYRPPKKVNYKGKVYCVSVPSGIILIRRHGEATFCGNCIHNAFACGRPPIVKREYYKGQLADELMRDGETCIFVDKLGLEDIIKKVEYYSDPIRYENMARNAYLQFKKVVDFDKEELLLRDFFDKLI